MTKKLVGLTVIVTSELEDSIESVAVSRKT